MYSVVSLLLILLVGVSLGLLGGGGSILLIPILVYVEGVSAQDAVIVSLAVVGAGSAFGAWLHSRRDGVYLPTALIFAAFGSAGALTGARFTSLVPDPLLMLIFGCLMVVVGSVMLRRRRMEHDGVAPRFVPCALVGLGVGLMTGFLGIGGGFLLVPAMVLVAGLDMHRAVGTALAVIAMNSLSGLSGHLWSGASIPSGAAAALGVVLVGMVAGTLAGHGLRDRVLERAFAGLVVLAGLFVVGASVARLMA